MKRFRLSTLMLLVMLAALLIAMVSQNRQAVCRERDLKMRMELLSQELAASRDREAANAAKVQAREVQKTEMKKDDHKRAGGKRHPSPESCGRCPRGPEPGTWRC